MAEQPKSAGVLLRELRLAAGLSQERFAHELFKRYGGPTHGYIGFIERGTEWPSVEALERFAAVLDTEPDVFWEYKLAQVRALFDERENFGGAVARLRLFEQWLTTAPGRSLPSDLSRAKRPPPTRRRRAVGDRKGPRRRGGGRGRRGR
ncbi:MAG: helix-turn-helix domain-containing protein [Thermoanaerobaculia bacterium]